MFKTSTIRDEGGNANYPFYWSSTSHLDGMRPGMGLLGDVRRIYNMGWLLRSDARPGN